MSSFCKLACLAFGSAMHLRGQFQLLPPIRKFKVRKASSAADTDSLTDQLFKLAPESVYPNTWIGGYNSPGYEVTIAAASKDSESSEVRAIIRATSYMSASLYGYYIYSSASEEGTLYKSGTHTPETVSSTAVTAGIPGGSALLRGVYANCETSQHLVVQLQKAWPGAWNPVADGEGAKNTFWEASRGLRVFMHERDEHVYVVVYSKNEEDQWTDSDSVTYTYMGVNGHLVLARVGNTHSRTEVEKATSNGNNVPSFGPKRAEAVAPQISNESTFGGGRDIVGVLSDQIGASEWEPKQAMGPERNKKEHVPLKATSPEDLWVGTDRAKKGTKNKTAKKPEKKPEKKRGKGKRVLWED